MVTKVQRWGNSLGLRLPRGLARELNLDPGSEVNLTVIEGGILLKPVRTKTYRLEDLLSKVTKKNLHDESDVGVGCGREDW